MTSQSQQSILKKPFTWDKSHFLELFQEAFHHEDFLQNSRALEIYHYTTENTGKMLRPQLVFFAADLISFQSSSCIDIAKASEFIHLASLCHDDVIDSNPTRRGRPTAHTVWDNKDSILMGDIIYARANEILAGLKNGRLLKIFAHAIRRMCEAEIAQDQMIRHMDCTYAQYIEVIEGKTASLTSACLESVAVAAGDCRAEYLREIGLLLGKSFQIVDDILDYTGACTGKKTFNDLEEGKITLPLILLRKELPLAEHKALIEAIHSIDSDWLMNQFEQHHIFDQCYAVAQDFNQKAQRLLDSHFNLENHADILSFIDTLPNRQL